MNPNRASDDPAAGRIVRSFASRGFNVQWAQYLPDTRMRRHSHAEARIILVLRGVVEETVGRCTEVSMAGSVLVKPPDVLHQDVFGPERLSAVILSVEPSATEICGRDSVLTRWQWCHGGPLTRSMLRMFSVISSSPVVPEDEIENCIADVLASTDDCSHVRGGPPRWLDDVRIAIHDQRGAGLLVRSLAATAGVHPVYLARQFRRYFGVSVVRYIRRIRACEAARALGTSRLPLAQIAVAAGFADQSHLCRTFAQTFGTTPAAFRRLSQKA
jgi:AraC family transcriptional regulator